MIVVPSEQGRFPTGLLVASAFWGLIFAFFGFHKSDDSTICLASNSDDIVHDIPEVDGDLNSVTGLVDVADRFHVFFMIGFYLCTAQLLVGLMTHMVQGYDITRFLHNVYHFSQILFLGDWIFGFYIRFTPSGQACCGTWD